MSFIQRLKEKTSLGWIGWIILVLLIGLSVAGAFLANKYVRRMVATNETFSLPGDPVIVESADEEDQEEEAEEGEGDPDETPSAPEANLPDPDPWDGTSRVNVLVMGLDLRDEEAGKEAPRSDTMILLSMDPLNNTAAVIAIPRDMWVAVPGFGNYKINTAFRFGELYNIPGGGPELASRTVEEFLGVPVHYYVQVDFQAFVDFIDHIKGIKVTFDEPYTIDRRGKWNTVTLEPGTYVLDGEYALAYARDRKSEGDDFDRSSRQLEVILLIRQRILKFDMLPTLVLNAPAIYEDLSSGINTNMSLSQVIQLAWKATDIRLWDIDMVVIGPEHISFGKSSDGLEILIPIPDKIRLLRDEVFGSKGVLAPTETEVFLALVQEENARITLLNASYQPDLAERTAAWLSAQGLNVTGTGSSPSTTISTVDLQGTTPHALSWLVETFGMTTGHIDYRYAPDAEADIVLILGDDWANNNPMQ